MVRVSVVDLLFRYMRTPTSMFPFPLWPSSMVKLLPAGILAPIVPVH